MHYKRICRFCILAVNRYSQISRLKQTCERFKDIKIVSQIKEYIRDGRAPIPEKELTSKVMSAIKDRNTKPELCLRKELWHTGIRGYRIHWNKVPGRPDIAFPGKRLALFVNGCFWHRCPFCNLSMPKSHREFWVNKFQRNIERDKIKIDQLESMDWRTITIWECQIKNNIDKCIEVIKKTLKERT